MDSSVLSFLDSPTLTSIHDYWTTWTHDFYLKIRREMRDSGTGIQKWLLTCGALAFNVPIDSDLKLWLRTLPCSLTGSWIHASWRAEWQQRENFLLVLPQKKRWKLVSLFWHSDHQREKELWVCGWKGHFFSQLDEVSAVSLEFVDIAPPSSLHPFPSQPVSHNSFHIFPLFPPYHALSFQKTLERKINIACALKI